MIKDDYCNFETAKLLKEKGFYGECLSMYLTPKPNCGMGNPHEAKLAPHGRDSHYYDGYLYQCEAPTLQMAMKWLRETHNIHPNIVVEVYGPCATYMIDRIFDGNEEKWVDFKSDENPSNIYSKREEACEAAIKYCLENLI